MSPILQKVESTIRSRSMISPGSRVGVAVSGGADSIALLDILHGLASKWQLDLTVLHVNYGLREAESDGDVSFVESASEALGLPFESARLTPSPEANLEESARELRYAWFRERMLVLQLDRVALGHTRSDQAETVLFRFLRGAGTAGLAGIRPVTKDGFVRPLIDVSRDELRAYLIERGVAWREDSSNYDTRFARNRIRVELMPLLQRDWNPEIESVLASTANWAEAEENFWNKELQNGVRAYLDFTDPQVVIANVKQWNALPVALIRRLLREAVKQVRGDLRSVDFAHIEQLRHLAAATPGSGRVQIPGVDAILSFGWVRFAAPNTYGGNRFFAIPVTTPGEYALGDTGRKIVLQVENGNCLYNRDVNCLDEDRVGAPMELRTWQPGDWYRPLGRDGEAKLKTMFGEARIPLWERRAWPVLTAAERIVWTRQFGVAADVAPSENTQRTIVVQEVRD